MDWYYYLVFGYTGFGCILSVYLASRYMKKHR